MEVFVTSRAEQHFDKIIVYLKYKWGEKTAKEFIDKVDEIFSLLKNYPSIGQVETKNIRGFQLTPHTRILYRIKDNKIIILSFFDSRQDPKKKFH